MSLFDIVIPVGHNDKDIIKEQIEYTKKNIIGYRNIYLISYDAYLSIDGCITINENIFPFNIDTVARLHGILSSNRWYLQQLLKLYSGNVIPNILDRYLVIDSDTFFLKPTTFIESGKCLYNFGKEYYIQHFIHMAKLDEDFVKIDENMSGICHHMMFETNYVNEIISKINKSHYDFFYNVFLDKVSDKTFYGASVYEIYFNYMLKNHPTEIKIRKLNWKNSNNIVDIDDKDYDYMSYN